MKQSIKEALTKKALKLNFFEENHKYVLEEFKDSNFNPKELISVSELVKKYKEPFDPDGSITARSALKKGITPREMADEWKVNNKKATDKGTLTHKIAQDYLEGTSMYPPTLNAEIMANYRLLIPVCDELKPYLIACEQIIFNETLGVAGTPDVLTLYQDKIDIWDFKTDKNPITIDDNRYNKYFLPPLQSLPANSFYYYALKMSIYRYLLELDGYEVNTLGLLHICKDEIKEIILPYLKEEVRSILDDIKNTK